MPKIVAIIVARMGSSRLPGKVLMPLKKGVSAGTEDSVLTWVTERVRACGADEVIVATTTEAQDDAIVEFCLKEDIPYFRGSEENVLERFVGAAKAFRADIAVRITGDCPFVDWTVIDQVLALQRLTDADYANNIWPPTWPDGLDVDVIKVGVLEQAIKEANSEIDKSCVVTWIDRNRHRFKCETLVCPVPGMHRERWVLDTEDDYKFCQAVADNIGFHHTWTDILAFLDKNPKLRELNAHHPRNERFYAAMGAEDLRPRTFENSKKLLARAKERIPLGAQTFSKSEIQYPSETPLFVTHGDGGYCYDVDGNGYVDLVGGLLPVILGHRDPDVDYAIRLQLNNGISFSLATELESQLSEILCRLIPCAEMVRFGKNGTDVTSAAVRLARVYTNRRVIITSGYHGWADWAVAGDTLRGNGVYPQDTILLKHGDSEHLWKLAPMQPAAVIVEPETDPEFLRSCRSFCDMTGALLIFDEVITGFRYHLGGAQKIYNVTPDLACFGKAMANGMPLAALVGKREYMKEMVNTFYSGTYFGETLSLAAAIATIEKLEREHALETIHKRGKGLWDRIFTETAGHELEFQLEGSQYLPRLRFANNELKTLFIQEMAQQGVLIISSHNLSYAHDDACMDRVLRAYKTVIPILEDAVKYDIVKKLIKGRPIPAEANVRGTL